MRGQRLVLELGKFKKMLTIHFRPQRARSFWSAPLGRSNFLNVHRVIVSFSPRFVRLDSEHAQIDGKPVNRGLPVLDIPRCSPKGARPLKMRLLTILYTSCGGRNSKPLLSLLLVLWRK